MKKSKLKYIGQPKTILAIDASTNSIAFSIFEERELIKFGKINFQGNHVYEKTGDATRKTSAFLKDYDIDAIVIESAIFTNSQKTAINLSLVQGAILGASQMYKKRVIVSCSPVSWQNWIGNKRLTKEEKLKIKEQYPDKSFTFYKAREREYRKQRTIRIVNIEFTTEINDDDVADAVAIGWYSCENWSKLVEQPHNLDKKSSKVIK
jgi:Holliday junction resolvasome RuvABC endonuclease subunit